MYYMSDSKGLYRHKSSEVYFPYFNSCLDKPAGTIYPLDNNYTHIVASNIHTKPSTIHILPHPGPPITTYSPSVSTHFPSRCLFPTIIVQVIPSLIPISWISSTMWTHAAVYCIDILNIGTVVGATAWITLLGHAAACGIKCGVHIAHFCDDGAILGRRGFRIMSTNVVSLGFCGSW